MSRHISLLDNLLIAANNALNTIAAAPQAEQASPAAGVAEQPMSDDERQHAARLMRIDHTGEVCAQALYHGQALSAKSSEARDYLQQAAQEEGDHLAWCEERIHELGGTTSLLNPAFYAGSFALGTLAGLAGDRWSLGFVVETENQVTRHLEEHLQRLPSQDARSKAILEQMRIDEEQHAEHALERGGAHFPAPLKLAMKATAKVMTGSTYYV